MLLESHPAIFGKSGLQLQLDLMMRGGRAVRGPRLAGTAARGRARLPALSFAAGRGGRGLRRLCGRRRGTEHAERKSASGGRLRGTSSCRCVRPWRFASGTRSLARSCLDRGPAGLAGAAFRQFDALRPLGGPADLLRQEADIRVLRGSAGPGARRRGRRPRSTSSAALDVWGDDIQAAAGAGLDFPTRPIAQQMMRLLEGSGGPAITAGNSPKASEGRAI